MTIPEEIRRRAALHGALGDPFRLAIVESLRCCDRSPIELRGLLGLGSNLLAHHLDVLEEAGFIERLRSGGDGRRRYIHLDANALDGLTARPPDPATSALFICSANSARSQLAAGLWRTIAGGDGSSAGTRPARSIHSGALAAARRAGIDLEGDEPRELGDAATRPGLVVTVCDRAHEELEPGPSWLHWSIPDPVADGSPEAFDAVVAELTRRIRALLNDAPVMEDAR